MKLSFLIKFSCLLVIGLMVHGAMKVIKPIAKGTAKVVKFVAK